MLMEIKMLNGVQIDEIKLNKNMFYNILFNYQAYYFQSKVTLRNYINILIEYILISIIIIEFKLHSTLLYAKFRSFYLI